MAPTSSSTSLLSSTQRYAAGVLFAIALHQAQTHQIRPLGVDTIEDDDQSERADRRSSGSSSSNSSRDSVSDDPDLWVHENSGLLRPVFRFLEIDSAAWSGMEETAGSSTAKHHAGAFMRLLSEESNDASMQNSDQELALSKSVDFMAQTLETNPESFKSKKEKHQEYEHECREKLAIEAKSKATNEPAKPVQDKDDSRLGMATNPESSKSKKKQLELQECMEKLVTEVHSKATNEPLKTVLDKDDCPLGILDGSHVPTSKVEEKPVEEERMLSYHRKVTVLYELLSACLADKRDGKKYNRRRRGYDARHRVALRLLATWLDVNWIKMDAIETMVACSAMAVAKQEQQEEEAKGKKSKWARLKRGGIIGAAAVTGGALMAITGGLAAPAIAAGLSALAPTLGTIIPVIGVSGFAAAATAAGTVAGSVAVAASFGAAGAGLAGTKMARRTGNVDEFEFKVIGESHNQGRLAVEILISGFVFEEDDFIKPWVGHNDNMERYALQWESKHLIAVSTAIQDWLTSSIALALMKQGAMLTVLSALLTALAWPATILAATDFIDSSWTIAIDRSDKAGKLLAEVLLKGLQGDRPVTLVGYSLGARIIFKCLETLAETERNAEIVERVVLLGAPIAIKDENWETARRMVAGRFVNAYSTRDWMLGVAFRASLFSKGLAGIQPVDVMGIENVDVTDLIEGHSSYLWATQHILDRLELDAYYHVFNSSDPVNEQAS